MADRPYHHGALRAALLDAGERELAEAGPEAFSLRRVARRAGVSHAAPAHHFGDVGGLLTALAGRGFERLLALADRRAAAAGPGAEERLMAYGLAYMDFAREHTALFRLCFASTRIDPKAPVFEGPANAAFTRLAELVGEARGRAPFGPPPAMAETYRIWAVAHGMADLMASRRIAAAADAPPAERDALARAILAPLLARDAPSAGQGRARG